jgi:signal transduction histidine kinase
MAALDLTLTLHLIAGLGAAGLGLGALARAPSRTRNRDFALLCLAIALWNLGFAGHRIADASDPRAFRMVYLAGSCATAPLALRFVLGLCGVDRRRRRLATTVAGLAAAALWVAGWAGLDRQGLVWAGAALVALGSSLVGALAVLTFRVFRTPAGPERRALALILVGGLVGVAGSLSDFVPRGATSVTELGPIAVMVFLLFVGAVVVRHRLLDIDVFLARFVALAAGATVAALVFLLVLRHVDPTARFVTLFLTSAVVMAALAPLVRLLATRTRSLLSPTDPVARALRRASRTLASARSSTEVRDCLDNALAGLPEGVEARVHFRRREQARFRRTFGTAEETGSASPVDPHSPIPVLLESERNPVTRRYLEAEWRDSVQRDSRIEQTLEQMRNDDAQLLVPIFDGRRLAGWIALGGALARQYATEEVATALLAVGNQALASLERVEAIEVAQRRRALAAVGELAAGLAHEVRNPVAAIRGAAQAMGPGATERQRDEMRDVIEEETERLGRFVGEFLDYARPGSPRRETIDPATLFARCLQAQRLAGRHIEAEVSILEPAPHVAGDPDQLSRVLDNLLQNAWEAGGDGVRVRLEVHASEGGRVTVRFEDNGPGVADEEQSRLFRPFHTTKERGTGLGLALVHRIVEAHGGEIRVDSPPGAGAAFTLVLPSAEGETDTEQRS